jgi:hypothetical protein
LVEPDQFDEPDKPDSPDQPEKPDEPNQPDKQNKPDQPDEPDRMKGDAAMTQPIVWTLLMGLVGLIWVMVLDIRG